ncbi:hypothetical protein DFJ74DRAFT_664974 [Hyaloraphidium curvatum]|nr:hypothetical protein DFJ74DRAFT_664974 [Hyaloraphidium curvatum]
MHLPPHGEVPAPRQALQQQRVQRKVLDAALVDHCDRGVELHKGREADRHGQQDRVGRQAPVGEAVLPLQPDGVVAHLVPRDRGGIGRGPPAVAQRLPVARERKEPPAVGHVRRPVRLALFRALRRPQPHRHLAPGDDGRLRAGGDHVAGHVGQGREEGRQRVHRQQARAAQQRGQRVRGDPARGGDAGAVPRVEVLGEGRCVRLAPEEQVVPGPGLALGGHLHDVLAALLPGGQVVLVLGGQPHVKVRGPRCAVGHAEGQAGELAAGGDHGEGGVARSEGVQPTRCGAARRGLEVLEGVKVGVKAIQRCSRR